MVTPDDKLGAQVIPAVVSELKAGHLNQIS
jgi:hypothetical protein